MKKDAVDKFRANMAFDLGASNVLTKDCLGGLTKSGFPRLQSWRGMVHRQIKSLLGPPSMTNFSVKNRFECFTKIIRPFDDTDVVLSQLDVPLVFFHRIGAVAFSACTTT